MMKKLLLFLALVHTSLFASELTDMQDACERNMAGACWELGTIYSGEEEGLKAQLEKSEYYLQKACELDFDKACQLLDRVQEKLSHK